LIRESIQSDKSETSTFTLCMLLMYLGHGLVGYLICEVKRPSCVFICPHSQNVIKMLLKDDM